MSRVYVGNLDSRVNERELEDEFRSFGAIRSVWVARRPPGYGFIDFEDTRDAKDAIHELDGKNGWRVQLSYNSRDGGDGGGGHGGGRGGDRGGRCGGSDLKCYECGEAGHFARECISRGNSGRRRSRSRSPIYRRSPSYGRRSKSPRGRPQRDRSLSPRVRPQRERSLSPRVRTQRDRNVSPRERSRSPAPARCGREEVPYTNGNGSPRGRPQRNHNLSPRGRSNSRSPVRCEREEVPYVNGNGARDEHRSRS